MNAYHRISESVQAVTRFHHLMQPKVIEADFKTAPQAVMSDVSSSISAKTLSPEIHERAVVIKKGSNVLAESIAEVKENIPLSVEIVPEGKNEQIQQNILLPTTGWDVHSPNMFYFGIVIAFLGLLKLFHKAFEKLIKKPHVKKE